MEIANAGCVAHLSFHYLVDTPHTLASGGLPNDIALSKSWISQARLRTALVPPKNLQRALSPNVGCRVFDDRRTQASAKATEPTAPRSVPVQVAHELLNAGHHYLDVRTPEEFNAGHVKNAINVPYMFKAGEGMTKNPNFTQEVLSHFSKNDEIVVGCQSGRRSLMAAADLMAAEFTGITDVGGGYTAWVQSGLPVTTN